MCDIRGRVGGERLEGRAPAGQVDGGRGGAAVAIGTAKLLVRYFARKARKDLPPRAGRNVKTHVRQSCRPRNRTPAARKAFATLVGPKPIRSPTRTSDNPERYNRTASAVCS